MSFSVPARLRVLGTLVLFGGALLGACGGSSGGTLGTDPDVGLLSQRPDGGPFFVDENRGGQGASLGLAQTLWARLVDVHDSDAAGVRSAAPLIRGAPVRPDLGSDGLDYRLETDALGREALVILHARDTAGFASALRAALQDLPALAPKASGSAPPFDFVARNAALVLRFDDLLLAGPDEVASLGDDVRVRVGSPPQAGFAARAYFDPSHGALVGGSFHPTRVVVDLTTSQDELEAGGNPLALNVVGLPASPSSSALANVEVSVPTRIDAGSGQFTVLRNLRGRAPDPADSAPFDDGAPTLDLVRALRSGNEDDPNNGFLRDDVPPTLVGRWAASVQSAVPEATAGDFVVRLAFQTACAQALEAGDLLETGAGFLQVARRTAAPAGGVLDEVHVHALGALVPAADELLGEGHALVALESGASVDSACWLEVSGRSGAGLEVTPEARFRVRFSEPMDPRSVDPLETLRLYRGAEAGATTTVVGAVSPSPDATLFDFTPALPLEHAQGVSEVYSLELVGGDAGASDLAGNALSTALPVLELALLADAPSVSTGGVSLRFDGPDEYPPSGTDDLRGTFTYDTERGALQPRGVVRQSWPIDGSSGVSSLMFPLPVGIQDPLVRFGSRLQTLWRYADFGWAVTDESHYDVDVEGLAWAPFSGHVNADFFAGFEVRLGHSPRLPDEDVNPATGALAYPSSGLLDAPAAFDQNVLEPGGARVVHASGFGYRLRPSDLFTATTGRNMLPFPLQGDGGRNEPFTWRDTSVQGVGGLGGGGVPLAIEKRIDPTIVPGSVAPAGLVPSFGLPLLMEFRTQPSDTALATNPFQVAIATNVGSLLPTWRVHSSGGQASSGNFVRVDPDQSPVPTGGFDPNSTPPGLPTLSAFPAVYFGQLDTVTRLTRVHTVWFDSGSANPDYLDPLVAPSALEQPAGTSVLLEFRGATGFVATGGAEFDARRMDPYGELITSGTTLYPGGNRGWSRDIDEVDGRRFVQVRITFVNNVDTGLTPSLDSLSLAFRRGD